MGIFNNIVTALSTPNELLMNFVTVPATILENYLLMTLFANFLNISKGIKPKIIYITIMSLFSLISIFIIENPFNVVFNYLMMILTSYFIFKNSFLKTSLSVITAGIIYNIEGALILNPFITILNITSDQLSDIPIYRLLYIIIVYSILSLIIFLLRYRKVKFNLIDTVDKRTKLIMFSNVILGMFTIMIQSVIAVYFIDKLPIAITFSSFVSLLAYFLLSIYSLTRSFKLSLTTQKLESANEYNNTLRILHDNVRAFKHDFDNIVTTIGGYIKTEDIEGLSKYYSQLEDDCQKVNDLYILNPEIINNNGIYNLLTKKYHEAESNNIKVNLTFLLDLNTLNMKIYEFARILGILLDNAIEASSECDEKIINIIFKNDYRNFRQLVIIENTYNNVDVDTEKIFEKGVSGKENHTGLGLWETRKIVKKNNNINLFTSKNEKYFVQQLEIYNKS